MDKTVSPQRQILLQIHLEHHEVKPSNQSLEPFSSLILKPNDQDLLSVHKGARNHNDQSEHNHF